MFRARNSYCCASTLTAALLGTLAWSGCAPQLSPSTGNLPNEINALISARSQVEIAENDPAFGADVGRVVDDLSGLDGCWGSFTSFSPPEGLPPEVAANARNDVYMFYHFDMAASRLTRIVYGTLNPMPLASVTTYRGPFTITDGNRLTMTADEFTIFNPITSELLVFPESFIAELEEMVASGRMSEEERQETLASFDEPLVFEYLVTLEGDRLSLMGVWEDDDGTQGQGETEVCFRIDCPG